MLCSAGIGVCLLRNLTKAPPIGGSGPVLNRLALSGLWLSRPPCSFSFSCIHDRRLRWLRKFLRSVSCASCPVRTRPELISSLPSAYILIGMLKCCATRILGDPDPKARPGHARYGPKKEGGGRGMTIQDSPRTSADERLQKKCLCLKKTSTNSNEQKWVSYGLVVGLGRPDETTPVTERF